MITRRPLSLIHGRAAGAPHFVKNHKTHNHDCGAYVLAMTDSAAGVAPPSKKKFAFKKAAWQTAPKAEETAQADIFSHSNEFQNIVDEQAKRKDEERKKKAEETRKRKADEELERKRRKMSTEAHEKTPGSGSASSARGRRLSSKGYSASQVDRRVSG